ncbi:MAG: hypothetical protein CMM61_07385 [Rhodospirillaceae bacterium]|nr:hypothetical protein [Rhodospirillaceae bacterium]
MRRHRPHSRPSVLIAALFIGALLSACAQAPESRPFSDMQAEQAAIQAALTSGETDTSRSWQGPGGTGGTVTLKGGPDAEGCRRVEAAGPGGAVTDTWCPTPHGFWVHPDELFYRNATGRETYGGSLRSRDIQAGAGVPSRGAAAAADRPDQIDCLRLLRDERRLKQDGRDSAARAKSRAFHRCLQRSD